MNGRGYQRRISYRLLLMTLWVSLLVFAVELIAGWISHTLCLLALSLHTLIDIFSTTLSLVAVASPQRTLGKEIWGHGRGEAAGALVLSAILGFAGISIGLVAFDQLRLWLQTQEGAFSAFITMPLMILVGVMMAAMVSTALLTSRQSKRNSSVALRLNAEHILNSVWINGALLLGLAAIWGGYRWLDPVLGIVVVVLASRRLWTVLYKQLPMLLKPTAIAPEAISRIVCQIEGITRCTRILSRGMVGRQVWIELHIVLHPEYMTIASSVGEKIERSLREHYGPVRAQIWLDNTHPQTARNDTPSIQRHSDPIGPK
ncbi:MAG: cation diffusion facilitator family transporter [Cyanobacteria bacterium J06581_3]